MGLADFLNMGGYAVYVWPAYGIALLVLVVNILLPVVQRQRLLRKLRQLKLREQKHESNT